MPISCHRTVSIRAQKEQDANWTLLEMLELRYVEWLEDIEVKDA